jgi:predicted Zn-dependent protease
MCNDPSIHGPKAAPHEAFMPRRRMLKALGAGGAAATLAACSTNPETGRKQFTGLAPSNLSDAAASSWNEMKTKIPTSNDPRYTRRLANIGGRISRGAGRGDQKWDYEVFDTDDKNAFVLPGNRVGFYKGMMDFTDNDDQIAGIMGHEVGHISGKHAQERISQQMAGQLVTVGGTIIGGSQISKKCNRYEGAQRNACLRSAQQKTAALQQALGLGVLLGITLPYNRRQEAESDLLGANYMYRAGYDTRQSVKLWEKMAANSTSRQPSILSTHPDPAWRAQNLADYITRQEKLGSQGFKNIRT